MKFLKKSLAGYKEVEEGNQELYAFDEEEYRSLEKMLNDSDKRCQDLEEQLVKSEVELGVSESSIEALKSQLSSLKREANDKLSKQNDKITKLNKMIDSFENEVDEKDNKIRILEERLQLSETSWEETCEEYREEREYFERKADNLERICRERSNAARGITPKKEHDGYIVTESREWVEKCDYVFTAEDYDVMDEEWKIKHPIKGKAPYTFIENEPVWKSVVQTPHSVDLELDILKESIREDGFEDDGVIFEDLNIRFTAIGDDNASWFNIFTAWEDYNVLYKWNFKANYKTGLWEMEIFTTKQITVPAHRRPVEKKNK